MVNIFKSKTEVSFECQIEINRVRALICSQKNRHYTNTRGFPGDSVVKNLPANVGDTGDWGSIPGSGRPPEEGNGNSLQYSCLGNPMDRGAWWTKFMG